MFKVAKDFAAEYQGFWQKLFVEILSHYNLNGAEDVCKEFWSSTARFSALFQNPSFVQVYRASELDVYGQLIDEMSANPWGLAVECLCARLKEVANFFPVLMRGCLKECSMEASFVLERVGAAAHFASILSRRAECVVESKEDLCNSKGTTV